jgi:hypothetical protein
MRPTSKHINFSLKMAWLWLVFGVMFFMGCKLFSSATTPEKEGAGGGAGSAGNNSGQPRPKEGQIHIEKASPSPTPAQP